MNITNPISIICLQERWTDQTTAISLYNLNNYAMIHQEQGCCGHGGPVICVHNQLNWSHTNIAQFANGLEFQSIEISYHRPHSKNI